MICYKTKDQHVTDYSSTCHHQTEDDLRRLRAGKLTIGFICQPGASDPIKNY